MKEQPTTELLDILNNIDKKDMSAYIKEFAATASAAAPFPEYIAEHGIAIADVVKRCRGILSKSYVYDILNGTKRSVPRCCSALMYRRPCRSQADKTAA